MTINITPEMIAALATLREWARMVPRETYPAEVDTAAAKAIDVLDNRGVFAAIDEVTGYDVSAVGASFCNCDDPTTSACIIKGHPLPELDTAEWGDTTRADMARRQQQSSASI